MIFLENDRLCLGLDESGCIVSFINKVGAKTDLIDSPADGAFFIVLDDSETQCKETLAFAKMQDIRVGEVTANSASFIVDSLKIDNGRAYADNVDISLSLHVTLNGDAVEFTADIDNRTDLRITDFEYPRVGKIRSLGNGKPALFWPEQPGHIYTNIGARLSGMSPRREYGSNGMSITYPGTASLGLCALFDKSESLFLEIRDPDFLACELKAEGAPEDNGAVTLSVDKYVCVKNGCMTTAPIVLRLYTGDWHYGAGCYANWMSAYRPAHIKPDWIREMTGYFLVINKQQYGYEMWDYTTLPQLWELARAHGCSTLALFGWYQSGHDNNYPDLEVSHTMGGEDVLKENIKAVQDNGGRVTLYYQGHLIDTGSEYYRSGEGERVACKTNWGTPYPEFYVKSHKSGLINKFSKKTFVIGCPSCPQWREKMVEREKWIADLGADGTLYDQIGGMPPYVCFDESHPHDGGNPARALPGGQTKLLDQLQTGAKAISPDFAFMSEHITDLYSAYLDAVHAINNVPGAQSDRANEIGGDSIGIIKFPDLFRYCFPDAIITVRNPNPFIARRMANYAFAFSFPLEMELRYRADREDVLADKFAQQREYAAKISALRKKYMRELVHGVYIDDECIKNPDPTMIAKAYKSDGTIAVTLWNDSSAEKLPDITVLGRKLVSFETEDGIICDTLRPLPADSVAVAIYR